jgi:hypothetical protein
MEVGGITGPQMLPRRTGDVSVLALPAMFSRSLPRAWTARS